ncbi:MAG: redoxin domain-containing protein [Planctomycetales bacterium]|nr:redoxin domain-containing protein [Planctomycetales bacterium]
MKRTILWTLLWCFSLPTCGAVAAELARSTEADNSAEAKSDAKAKTPEGHSQHGEAFNEGPRQAAYLMGNTGNVSFPIRTHSRLVQQFIDQGVGQLHGFWYLEAERSFRQAAALDPKCAAAYWGMAMANANNNDRAKKFIKEAVDRKENASDRVKLYIEALDKKLNAKDKKDGFEAYIKSLEKVVYDYPDDIEAKAFIALEMWQGRGSGVKIASHVAVDALLSEVFAKNPMHPCHHYRIHLWDYEKPERALKSSALCGQAAPGIAHMWHMPGHIFSRLKRYEDAVWQQEASARTDHAHMMRDQLLPDQIHNFAHNNEWLIRNMMFIGRVSDALDLAKNMISLPRHPRYNLVTKRSSSSHYGRTRLFQVLSQGELWKELIELSDSPYLEPTDEFPEQIKRLRYVGRAHGWLGDISELAAIRSELQTLHDKLSQEKKEAVTKAEDEAANDYDEKNQKPDSDDKDTDKANAEQPESKSDAENDKKRKEAIEKASKKEAAEFDRKLKRIKQALDELDGHAKLAAGDGEEALKLFKSAGEIDKWQLAMLKHLAGQTDQAITDLEDYIDGHAGETLPLAYLAEVFWQADKKDEARKAFEKLQQISSSIDLDAPPYKRLAPLANAFNFPADWRKASVDADDIGDRPNLDDLGPFRWQPFRAPSWTLEDSDGQTALSSEFEGQPVIYIFFLGHGCLHCAEQLHAFAPQAEKFREAGIEMIAISSDKQTDLSKSVEDFGSLIPIRLVSDSELDVFKMYRAFDDFENQPLHGTFLIDGDGNIRWQDIGHEPFMDHEFVLKEAKRLLGTD